MAAGDTERWLHKWVVLLMVLGWLFLYRYRVMGYLLSKAIAYQLSKSHKLVPITVRVERVSLQPLRFFKVELSSHGVTCGRIVFTKVEVQSHVKEFFESFGLVKICILMIEEVVGDVDRIDDQLLQAVLMPNNKVARYATQKLPKMNPICYLRFVDLKVQNIRLRVDCLQTTTTLVCQGLYIGITDVSVACDLLKLEVQTKSVIFQSAAQVDKEIIANFQSDGSDGLRVEIPNTTAVVSLNLRNQCFLGCEVTGCDKQTTTVVMSTAHLERTLAARNDIIRMGIIAAGRAITDRSLNSLGNCVSMTSTPLEVGLNCFQLSFTLVNEVEPGSSVPVQFFANISKLSYRKQLEPWNDLNEIPQVITATTNDDYRIQVEAVIQSVHVHNLASNQRMLSVCCIEVQAKPSTRMCGVLTGVIQSIDISLSHYTVIELCSLIAAHERLVKSQMEVSAILSPTLVQNASTSADGRPALQDKRSRMNWNTEIQVMNWLLSFKALAKDGTTHNLTAKGSVTLIQTPLAPDLQISGSSLIKRSIVIQHVSVEVILSGLSPYSADFEGVELTMTASVDPLKKFKTVGMVVRFGFVSINGLRTDNSNEFSRFPALSIHEFTANRAVKEATEALEVDLAILMDKVVVKWHYEQHKSFLLEWAALKTIIDQLELLLSKSPAKSQTVSRILGIDIYSKDTSLDVMDITGVKPFSSFCLVETKMSHRATHLCATTAFNSANASVHWGEKLFRVTLSHVSIQHRKSLGRQRFLSNIPIQSDIRCSSMTIHLRPHSQMLLLVLRLDQLISNLSDKGDVVKRSSVHGLSFICESFRIEMGDLNEHTGSVELASLDIKMTRCTPREITEMMIRMSQCLRKEGLADRSFVEVAQQVQLLEGTASASTILVSIHSDKLIELQNTEIHFAITDVEWNELLTWEVGLLLPRTTGFDLSMLSGKIDVTLEKKKFALLFCLLPILQHAFETKSSQKCENTERVSKQPSFRQRFVGHLDIAFHNAELICPHGIKDGHEQQKGSKLTRVQIDELAFNLRQFQTFSYKCSPLRVLIEGADFVEFRDRHPDSLQLVFVPKVSVCGVVHWQQSIHYVGQLQYALSLEIAIGHTRVYDPPAYVPIQDEALVSLDWDCVVPWLIDVIIDDTNDYFIKSAVKESSSTKPVQCVGVQWDLSVHSIQFAWWDSTTQETGILIVANEFLTHGVMRMNNAFDLERENEGRWKLWETTVYLHLFRGYLLHMDDDYDTTDIDQPENLPFGLEMASNFSLETVGTTYRSSYTPNDDENWEVLDEEVTSMFAPSNVTIFDKMHETFVPIDYEFGIVDKIIPAKSEIFGGRLPMLHVPVSVRTSSAASSRPKSPRSAKNWTQTIRNRLSQLKRRSASMDNLFLKDGSCPIQVDAMRLLWTIQTRDSVFYMVSTTVDSLRLLLDAKRNAITGGEPRGIANSASLSPLRRAKGNSFRSPSFVATGSEIDLSDSIPHISRHESRRGSARDTLLELLQQGKLGMAQENCDLSSKSLDEETESTRESIGEDTSNYNAARATIAMKAYTVDIHDVQINVREENTRSNVLLASKHIHFEIGTDASDMNTIANLTFDSVTAHVAPIDVDISAGVLWYSHANVGSLSAPSSALLKQIMDECSLKSSFTHTQSTDATSTEVDLSFLELSTDRHQFYQLINIIRHVLLAPPAAARRAKRTFTPRTNSTDSTQLLEGTDITDWIPPTSTSTTLAGSMSTKKLHVLLEEELRNREIRTRGTMSRSKGAMTALKAISFKVVGMQWKLRLSPELAGADYEFVGIRIQGFTGCHSYFTNHCTKLTLNLQWLEIINLHPGPSSAAFKDSTAVLKAKLLVDKRFGSTNAGNQKGMLVLRAESGPIVRIYGQKLRVLDVLEVSMFPEVSNMIVIQLAADFYELIYKFLFENITPPPASSQNSELFFGRKSAYGLISPTASSSMTSLSQKGINSPSAKSRALQTTSFSQNTLNPLRKSNSAGSTNSMLLSNLNTSQTSFEDSPDESDSPSTDDCELFYVKYVRVGNVRLRINCNGFFVNLSHFDLELPPYICQSKLCTSKKLLQKFESHLKWYITKESASSGLSQFKNKLLKWTPSSSSNSFVVPTQQY